MMPEMRSGVVELTAALDAQLRRDLTSALLQAHLWGRCPLHGLGAGDAWRGVAAGLAAVLTRRTVHRTVDAGAADWRRARRRPLRVLTVAQRQPPTGGEQMRML